MYTSQAVSAYFQKKKKRRTFAQHGDEKTNVQTQKDTGHLPGVFLLCGL